MQGSQAVKLPYLSVTGKVCPKGMEMPRPFQFSIADAWKTASSPRQALQSKVALFLPRLPPFPDYLKVRYPA